MVKTDLHERSWFIHYVNGQVKSDYNLLLKHFKK